MQQPVAVAPTPAAVDDDSDDDDKKKDKKLVFLSRSVLQKVRERPMVTGTQIANEILEMYKKFCDVSIFCASPVLIQY